LKADAGGPYTLLIGSDGWRSDWIGAIDDVRIYDRALSEAEVLELRVSKFAVLD